MTVFQTWPVFVMSLMCYWALVGIWWEILTDWKTDIWSAVLFVLTLPFFRSDWTETVKPLVIVKLWINKTSKNFQLSEETYIRNSWFLFLHLVQRSRAALGTGKTTQFLLLSKAASPFICVPPIATKAKNYLLWVLNRICYSFSFGFFWKPLQWGACLQN